MYTTTDINIAAYVSLCGIEPLNVECKTNGIHVFNFDEEDIKPHVEAYNNGAQVPAKQYAEARQRMKTMRKAGRRERRTYAAVRHIRNTRKAKL